MREVLRLPAPVLVLAIMAGMALVAWALLAGSSWAMLAGTAGLIVGIKSAILLARRAGVTDQPQ
jgi:inner membrane protein involved in colicin E2 resistance